MTRVLYRGEMWSMHAIEKRLKIDWETLVSWRLHGGVSERRIDRYLAARDERRRLRALARKNGVPLYLMRHRLNALGWDGDEAATTPSRGRRRLLSAAE